MATEAIWGNQVDLSFVRGETFTVDFEVKDINNTPVDLSDTGTVVSVLLKKRSNDLDSEALIAYTLINGVSKQGSSNQIIRLSVVVDPAFVVGLTKVRRYCVKVAHVSGVTFYPYFGRLSIKKV